MKEPIARRQSPVVVKIPPCGIYVLESHHSDAFHMEIGRWPFDKLCWAPVGHGELEMSDRRFSIFPNDYLLLPRDLPHRFIDNPVNPLTLVIACVERSQKKISSTYCRFLEDSLSSTPPGRPLRASNYRVQSSIGDAFRKMLREQSSRLPGHEVTLQTELGTILVQMRRGCSDSPVELSTSEQSITDALQYLDEFYYKPTRIADLADHYGISVRRFSGLFKKRTGKTFTEYVNCKRVESAKEKLLTTGNISYACLESGFSDLSYFYRVFKKHTGQPPGEYLRTPMEA